MPIYSYACQKCKTESDHLVGMIADVSLKCPSCGSAKLTKLITNISPVREALMESEKDDLRAQVSRDINSEEVQSKLASGEYVTRPASDLANANSGGKHRRDVLRKTVSKKMAEKRPAIQEALASGSYIQE